MMNDEQGHFTANLQGRPAAAAYDRCGRPHAARPWGGPQEEMMNDESRMMKGRQE